MSKKNNMRNGKQKELWTIDGIYQETITVIKEGQENNSPRIKRFLEDMEDIFRKYQNKSDVTRYAILETFLRSQDQKLTRDPFGRISVTLIEPEDDWDADDYEDEENTNYRGGGFLMA